MPRLFIHRQQRTAQYFTEDLGDRVGLDIVLIPGGTFLMGSPDTELDHQDLESPQHLVTVPTFFMGRYPVTQAQWKAVAAPKAIHEVLQFYLSADLNQSHFRRDQRPVENVSWQESVEFCDLLSRKTGRTYRLPTEAEWEYACRAGTTTPFHFGETITTDLANYRGTDWQIDDGTIIAGYYGRGPKGNYRGQTTDVGSFPANAFGLHDMHGNVMEWCLDPWHETYNGAPSDGIAWLSNGHDARVARGGSWDSNPMGCRSACRYMRNPTLRYLNIGFRVVCDAPRTP